MQDWDSKPVTHTNDVWKNRNEKVTHTTAKGWAITCRWSMEKRLADNSRPPLDFRSYLSCCLDLHYLSAALMMTMSFLHPDWAPSRCRPPCTACTELWPYSTAWNLVSGWRRQTLHCLPHLEASRPSWCSQKVPTDENREWKISNFWNEKAESASYTRNRPFYSLADG